MDEPLCALVQERGIFSMSAADERRLREKILDANGEVRIFVHPFYQVDREDMEKHRRIANETRALLQEITDASTPTVIFEEDMMLRQERHVNEYYSPHVYFVRTYIESHAPKFSHGWEPRHIDYYDRREWLQYRPNGEVKTKNWLALKEKFQELGVKTVLVGGVYMKILLHVVGEHPQITMGAFRSQRKQHGARNIHYNLEGCAGFAARELSAVFDVNISPLSFPDGPEDLMVAENDLCDPSRCAQWDQWR